MCCVFRVMVMGSCFLMLCLESRFQGKSFEILPCLAVEYAVTWMGDSGPIVPYMDDTLMMVPRPRRAPRSLLLGTSGACRQQTNRRRLVQVYTHSCFTIMPSSSFWHRWTPWRLTSSTFSQSDSSSSWICADFPVIPALLTAMSNRPNLATIWDNAALTSSPLRTSICSAKTSTPGHSFCMLAATLLRPSRLMSVIASLEMPYLAKA